MTPTVPAPRRPHRYLVGFVCSGNICRSPTAEVVFAATVAGVGGAGAGGGEAGHPYAAGIETRSCGLGDWHVNDPMDHRSAEVLRSHGYDPDQHRAQQFQRAWYDDVDLILAMDSGHLEDLHRQAPSRVRDRVRLFGDFDPVTPGSEVPDPYYGGPEGFAEVLAMVERTCEVLVPLVADRLAEAAGGDR